MTTTSETDTRGASSLPRRLRDTITAWWWLLRELLLAPRLRPARHDDRRILIMVTGFPPDVSGGAYRPAAIARYARALGWEPVIASWAAPARPSPAGLAMLDYVGAGVTVLRTPSPGLSPSYRLLPKVDGSLVKALEMVRAVRTHFGSDLPRVVLASGPSFSPFVAGWLLARGTDRKLVLEYRDEWTLCPFDFVSKEASDRAWELRCLGRADLVVTMTDSQRDALQSSFGQEVALPPVEVVANGWEPAFSAAATPSAAPSDGRIVITFAGKLGDYTHPGRFLQALHEVLGRRPDLVPRLQLRFVGGKDPAAAEALRRFPLPGVIQSIDPVPQAEAARMMRESHALLLIHNADFERYIPGKIYEYAASGAPILLFDDQGESARIVRGLDLGYALSSADDLGLEQALDRMSGARPFDATPESAARREDWLHRHRRERLVGELLQATERHLVGPSARGISRRG